MKGSGAGQSRNNIDLAAGLLFIALALWFLWTGAGFRLGTAAAMGPGYLPRIVAIALLILGLTIAARSFRGRARRIEGFGWRPLILTLSSMVVFALLISSFGIVVACG